MSALSDRIKKANKDYWSSRKIADEAAKLGVAVSHTAISLVLNGKHGTPQVDTLTALSKVFNIPMSELNRLVKLGPDHEPWNPPGVSARMSPKQRRLVETLIHELVRPDETEHRVAKGSGRAVKRSPKR